MNDARKSRKTGKSLGDGFEVYRGWGRSLGPCAGCRSRVDYHSNWGMVRGQLLCAACMSRYVRSQKAKAGREGPEGKAPAREKAPGPARSRP